MNRLWMVAGLMLATRLGAQPVVTHTEIDAPPVLSGPGWDAFVDVTYMGGDGKFPKKRTGVLLLTDSTLAMYDCSNSNCVMDKKRSIIKQGPPVFAIPLKAIKEIDASTQFKGTSTGSKLLLGAFAGDKSGEQLGIVYETASTAEAPVFSTQKAQAAAIEAKVKFRLKQLGVVLPAKTP